MYWFWKGPHFHPGCMNDSAKNLLNPPWRSPKGWFRKKNCLTRSRKASKALNRSVFSISITVIWNWSRDYLKSPDQPSGKLCLNQRPHSLWWTWSVNIHLFSFPTMRNMKGSRQPIWIMCSKIHPKWSVMKISSLHLKSISCKTVMKTSLSYSILPPKE